MLPAMSDTRVTYDLSDGVATMTLDDGRANVLSLGMQAEINGALDQAARDDAVVVIAGRPGVFSGGFDLATLRGGGPDAAAMLDGGFSLALRLLSYPTPVVIACTGHAVAMGSFLLLTPDYRVGARGAFRVVANEVAIGMTLPWTAIEVCRYRLTPSHFWRALNLATVYTPEEGIAAGWVDEVVEPDAVVARAQEVAHSFLALDRAAHRGTKRSTRALAIEAVTKGLDVDREGFQLFATS
jgi:enoyl-CoA hydratase